MKQAILISLLFIACCTAAFAQSNTPQCPKILIYVTGDLAEPGGTVQFFADVENYFGPDKLEYEWFISGDLKLISGEKSRLMQARRTGDEGGTVTVRVTPFPAGCENHASESAAAIDRPYLELIDEFPIISVGSKKANLHNFFIHLNGNTGSNGLIVISNGKAALPHARDLVKYMTFLKLDMALVSLVFASEPGDTTQFWLIPPGALEPKYKNAVYVRAQDFVNLERIFKSAKTVRKKTK